MNFAKTGNPNGEGLPEWPGYEAENDELLEIKEASSVVKRHKADKLDVWDAALDYSTSDSD